MVHKLSLDLHLKSSIGGKQIALTDRQIKLVEYLEKYASLGMKEARELLPNVSEDTVLRDLRDLVDKKLIARRVRREPTAYILGHKEFYGLDFLVNRNVLVPRPESETLVEQAFRRIMNYESGLMDTVVIDVGTGSGAIAVALAKELRIKNEELRVFAIDNSREALSVARRNAKRHGVARKIKFLRGNLLEPFLRTHKRKNLRIDELVVVANLPYLPTAEWRAAAPEVRKWEPRQALDGGRDGLKYYREMFRQVLGFRFQVSGTILCEICPHQVAPFKRMVRQYFKKAQFRVVKDLSGRARVISVNI